MLLDHGCSFSSVSLGGYITTPALVSGLPVFSGDLLPATFSEGLFEVRSLCSPWVGSKALFSFTAELFCFFLAHSWTCAFSTSVECKLLTLSAYASPPLLCGARVLAWQGCAGQELSWVFGSKASPRTIAKLCRYPLHKCLPKLYVTELNALPSPPPPIPHLENTKSANIGIRLQVWILLKGKITLLNHRHFDALNYEREPTSHYRVLAMAKCQSTVLMRASYITVPLPSAMCKPVCPFSLASNEKEKIPRESLSATPSPNDRTRLEI